jgi:Lar family restriction alleviation protein
MKVTELKPCPFCGGAPNISYYETESLWSHNVVTYTTVACKECDIGFSTEEGFEVEAPEAWNTRAMQSAAPSDEVKRVVRDLRFFSCSALGELTPAQLTEWAGASWRAIDIIKAIGGHSDEG